MNKEKLGALAERMLALHNGQGFESIDKARVLASDRYTDPDRFEREKALLFKNRPQLVALSADLKNSGDYLALTVAGLPVILIRHSDGEARAFVNACRHRAARLLSGRGECKRIVCPYHSWTYGTDGELLAVPHKALFDSEGLPKRDLLPLPLLEANGMIFVLPQADGGPIAGISELLGDLLPELDGFDLQGLNPIAEREDLLPINWKLGNDFVMEGYHVHHLHKNTVGLMSLPVFTHDSFGLHHRLAVPSPGLLELANIPADERDVFPHMSLVHSIFPSTTLVVSQTEVFLQRVEPADTPGESRVRLSTYTRDALDTDEQRKPHLEMFELLYTVQMEEDLHTMITCQQAFNSGAADTVVFGGVEPLLQTLHQQYDEILERD